jgi:hypothetical protein
MHGLAPQQKRSDHIAPSHNNSSCSMRNRRQCSSQFQTRRNRHALTLLRCRNGNVPRGGAGVHHHAHRQMVQRRIFALHSAASQAVLEGRHSENADALIVSNIPDVAPHMVSNEDPRQRNHRENAKKRQNIGRNAS